jgi:cytochrome c2
MNNEQKNLPLIDWLQSGLIKNADGSIKECAGMYSQATCGACIFENFCKVCHETDKAIKRRCCG